MSITISMASPEDYKALNRYSNKISQENTYTYLSGEPIDPERDKTLLIHASSQEFPIVYLAKEGRDKVVGLGVLYNFPKEKKKGSHKCGFKLSVDRDYRRRGIGTNLLEIILRTATAKNFKLITISVFGNNSGALTLYKKFGFTEAGRLPEGLFDTRSGVFVDEVFMYKKLL